MTWATSVWVGGFVCRSISVYNVQNVNLFIAQFVLIIIGPPLYAAAEYFILGRLMAYFPYHAPIHPGRVLSTFLILSAIVESLTANGAANSAGTGRTPSQVRSGRDCIKAALILQCFIEATFFSLVAFLHHRCKRAGHFTSKVRPVFYVLYITSAMMLVRCIVRVVEAFEASGCVAQKAKPYCGTIDKHEIFLWIFEIANITLFIILLAIFHPGKYLPRSSEIFLDPRDVTIERVGPGYSKVDKRPLLVTVLDPFNIYGILTGKGMANLSFWDEDQPMYHDGKIDRVSTEAESQGANEKA